MQLGVELENLPMELLVIIIGAMGTKKATRLVSVRMNGTLWACNLKVSMGGEGLHYSERPRRLLSNHYFCEEGMVPFAIEHGAMVM